MFSEEAKLNITNPSFWNICNFSSEQIWLKITSPDIFILNTGEIFSKKKFLKI